MKPVAKRARTNTNATSVAESVTEFVVVDDDDDGDDVDDSDEDIEPEKDPEAILGEPSRFFLLFHRSPYFQLLFRKTGDPPSTIFSIPM
jgi:hypothetical protein